MIETILKIYEEESLTLLIAAFIDSKNMDIAAVEKLPKNEQLDLMIEFVRWSAGFIIAQFENAKEWH